MRRQTSVTALAGLVATLGFATPAIAQAAESPQARIQITDEQIADTVPATFVGANHRWPRNGLGMWDPETGQPDPDLLAMSKRVGLGIVRYPGGTVANLFDWKKAIGPVEQRGCQVGGGFVGGAEPMDSRYGPDEHQRYVEAIGATTQIMMPAALSSTEDAADFVEYLNAPVGANPNGGTDWAAVRAANGHPEPYGVHWWEIGNEPYLDRQRYWRSADTDVALRQYAFGGTQRQTGQPLGTACDHRPEAGISDGSPGQSYRVHYPPVVADSQTVYVDGEVWREVADLAAAGPADRVYRFDPDTGMAYFGDGTHGAVPPEGASLTADYDSGPHPGFVDYYAAMKAVDPGISVCTSWRYGFVALMGTEHPYDCVGPHLYAIPDVSVPADELYHQMINSGPVVLGELMDVKREIARHRPNDRPPIEVSEYGAIPAAGTGPPPQGWVGSLGWTLYLADVTAGLVEQGVRIGNISNLNGEGRTLGELFGGAQAGFHYTARANLLELYSHLVGSDPVAVTELANPTPAGDPGYLALRTLATRAPDGTVRIMVVNRDRDRDVTTQLLVDGLTGAASVKVSTLNAPDVDSYNSPQQPDVVRIETSAYTVSAVPFTHQFPAHSVTLIELTPGR